MILRFRLWVFNKFLRFISLSWGSLASILAESSSKPMKVMQVVANSVFSSLIGTPNSEHMLRKVDNFSLHLLLKGGSKIRKSSSMCTMCLILYLYLATHSSAELKDSKMAQDDEAPKGRQQS